MRENLLPEATPGVPIAAFTGTGVFRVVDDFAGADPKSSIMTAAGALAAIGAQPRLSGTAAARPAAAAGNAGFLYWATDTLTLSLSDGAGWVIIREPRQVWAPAVTGGLTVGDGAWSVTSGFTRSRGWIDVAAAFVLGATSAVTGAITVTKPVNGLASVPAGVVALGELAMVKFFDVSTSGQYQGIVSPSATGMTTYAFAAAGQTAALAAATPFVWAAGDVISWSARYAMATQYS